MQDKRLAEAVEALYRRLTHAGKTTYRSEGRKVNQDDDMVRVVLDLDITEFRSYIEALTHLRSLDSAQERGSLSLKQREQIAREFVDAFPDAIKLPAPERVSREAIGNAIADAEHDNEDGSQSLRSIVNAIYALQLTYPNRVSLADTGLSKDAIEAVGKILWRHKTDDDYHSSTATWDIYEALSNLPAPQTEARVDLNGDVLAFLMGEAPLEGVWFGEKHPTEKGAFWWRKRIAHLQQPQPVNTYTLEQLELMWGHGRRGMHLHEAMEALDIAQPVTVPIPGVEELMEFWQLCRKQWSQLGTSEKLQGQNRFFFTKLHALLLARQQEGK